MAQYDPIAIKSGILTALGTDTLRADRLANAGLTTTGLTSGYAVQMSGNNTLAHAVNTSAQPIIGIYDATTGSIVRSGVVVAAFVDSPVVGDTVYLSSTAGKLTKTKPTGDMVHEVGVVVDPATGKILLQLQPVIALPPQWYIWTTNEVAKSVSKLLPDGTKIADYATPAGAWGICYDGIDSLWVTSCQYSPNNKVYKINKNTGVVTLTLTPVYGTLSIPTGICSDGTYVYVSVHHGSTYGACKQYALDGTPGWTVEVGEAPYQCCYDAQNLCVWVTSYNGGNVRKIRCSDGAVLANWGLPTSAGFGACFDPNTSSVWFCNRSGGGQTYKYRASDASLLLSLTGQDADPIQPATDGTYIYTSGRSSGKVTKFLATTGDQVYYTRSNNQYGCYCDPDGYLWVARVASAVVMKMRRSDGTEIGNYTTGANCMFVCSDFARLP